MNQASTPPTNRHVAIVLFFALMPGLYVETFGTLSLFSFGSIDITAFEVSALVVAAASASSGLRRPEWLLTLCSALLLATLIARVLVLGIGENGSPAIVEFRYVLAYAVYPLVALLALGRGLTYHEARKALGYASFLLLLLFIIRLSLGPTALHLVPSHTDYRVLSNPGASILGWYVLALLAERGSSRQTRAMALLFGALLLITLQATAITSTFVGALVILASRRRWRVLLALVAASALLFFGQSSLERTYASERSSTLVYRVLIWKQAFAKFQSAAPTSVMLGQPLGQAQTWRGRYFNASTHTVHNAYLAILLQVGILGAFLVTTLLMCGLMIQLNKIRQSRDALPHFALGAGATMMFSGLTYDWRYFGFVWLLLLALASARAANEVRPAHPLSKA